MNKSNKHVVKCFDKIILVFVLLISFGLTGCGSDNTAENKQTETAKPSVKAEAVKPSMQEETAKAEVADNSKYSDELIEKGKKDAESQSKWFEMGYSAYLERNYDGALSCFKNAEKTFTEALAAYRKTNKENEVKKEDIKEIIMSLSIVAAYNDLFDMQPTTKWIGIADEQFKQISKSKNVSVNEFKSILKTLKSCASLCKLYNEGKYEEAFKKLLVVEREALLTDRDFFIFEIRFMIASSIILDDLDEPIILNKAEEMLNKIIANSKLDENDLPDRRIMELQGLIAEIKGN